MLPFRVTLALSLILAWFAVAATDVPSLRTSSLLKAHRKEEVQVKSTTTIHDLDQLLGIRGGDQTEDGLESKSKRWNLGGKNIIVTGGTKGIGKAIVEECASLGATVFTCARDQRNLNECLTEWQNKGYNVVGVTADVTSDAGRQSFLSFIQQHLDGRLDGLVNNVGTNIRKRAMDYSEAEYDKIMQVNLHSAFHFTRMCQPLLKATADAHGGASVVNIGSVAGGCGSAMKSGVVYAMTKAAMTQMTYNLACEWAGDRIRVNTLAPWYIDTPLVQPVLQDPAALSAVLARTPMQRVGQAHEVSGLAAFLLMDSAGYITGQVISVDGGFLRNGFF